MNFAAENTLEEVLKRINRKFECTSCSKQYRNHTSYLKHVATCGKCPHCPLIFANKKVMITHIELVHTGLLR